MYKMNRPYLLLVCCLFLETHLSAQTEIGVHFGVNSCSFYDFYPSKIDILNRARIEDFSTPAVGLYLEIPLNDFLSVEYKVIPFSNIKEITYAKMDNEAIRDRMVNDINEATSYPSGHGLVTAAHHVSHVAMLFRMMSLTAVRTYSLNNWQVLPKS